MAQNITVGIEKLCGDARARVKELTVEEARAMHESGEGIIVDIRDVRELWRDGKIPGAIHAPRGMLEFWIDPESPYHKPVFAEDRSYIFSCAGGMRSLLATDIAQHMGMSPVYNLIGGFKAWREAGAPIEPHEPSSAKK